MRKTWIKLAAVASILSASLSSAGATPAWIVPGSVPAAPFDVRTRLVAPTSAQRAAAARLTRAGVRVAWNDRFGTPATILRYGATLTGPTSDAETAARSFLTANAAAFGWTSRDVAALSLEKNLEQPGNGPRILLFHQKFAGLDGGSFGGSLVVGLDSSNRIVSVRANVARGTKLAAKPALDAVAALAAAAGIAPAKAPRVEGVVNGWTKLAQGSFGATHYAKLAAFPTGAGTARPVWDVFFSEKIDSVWRTAVDAVDGSILYRVQTVESWAPEGRVFRNYPGAPRGGTHEMVSFRGDTQASPAGWLGLTDDDNRLPTTAGNNAYTATHWVVGQAPEGPGEIRPVSADGVFDFEFTDSWRKSSCGYVEQADSNVLPEYALDAEPAVLNLFYNHNIFHDFWYHLGFTPEAGAMQANNFGRAGLGGDPVIGLAQAGAGVSRNNAFMSPKPDGVPQYTAMYLWEPPTKGGKPPCVDGDFDAVVIGHEYTHGVTSRFVGAEYGNLDTLQGGAMGESWSDFFAMHYLHDQGLESGWAMGPYVTGDQQKAIRNFALNEVPLTYGDIGYNGAPEVHADGEIWSGLQYDIRNTLRSALGRDGADQAAQLIADGMPLSGPHPSMLDMRDGILAADLARFGGEYQSLLWTIFARHGMGYSARSNGGADTSPVQAFDHKDESENGRITLRLVDPVSKRPIWGAEVIGETVEASKALAMTDRTGRASLKMSGGSHAMTIRVRGYGSRVINVNVVAGKRREQVVQLSPNYASSALGGKVSDESLAALIDDSRFTSAMLPASKEVTIELGGGSPVTVGEVRVAAGRSNGALRSFKIYASTNGSSFKQVVTGGVGRNAPFRVGVDDVRYRSYRLRKPMRASQIKLVALTTQNGGANADVSEIQVFGRGDRYMSEVAAPLKLHDEGMLTTPIPATPDVAAQEPSMLLMSQQCGVPPTNGLDVWVTPVGPEFSGARMIAQAPDIGDLNTLPEFDVYFLDKDCAQISFIASTDPMPHESGQIPSKTRYIVVLFFAGPPTTVTVDAEMPGTKMVHL